MKIFQIAEKAREEGGEFVLGAELLKSGACYMVFGIIPPGEKDRLIKPGNGHEEIICIVSGTVTAKGMHKEFYLGPGQAFHLTGEESYLFDNNGLSEVVYVVSGGHSESGHHHH